MKLEEWYLRDFPKENLFGTILPPDFSLFYVSKVSYCLNQSPKYPSFFCSRVKGHTRRHAIGNGIHIVGVWK